MCSARCASCRDCIRSALTISSTQSGSSPMLGRGARFARRGAGGAFVALAVAYLIKEKGIDVAIRAVGELPHGIVLWVVGDGPEHGNLQSLAQDLGLGERVRFLGQRRHVEPLLQAADCGFAHPSGPRRRGSLTSRPRPAACP